MQSVAFEHPIMFTEFSINGIFAGIKSQTRRLVNMDKLYVRLPQDVHSDIPPVDPIHARALGLSPMCAKAGRHRAGIGDAGAVWAHLGDERLGVKPGEFDFVCPYAQGETVLGNYGQFKRWLIIPTDSKLWVKETWVPGRGLAHVVSEDILMAPAGAPLAPGILYKADGAHIPRGCHWRSPLMMKRQFSRMLLDVRAVRLEHLQDISEEDAKAEGITKTGKYWNGSAHQIKGTPKCFPTARDAYIDIWQSINGKRAPSKSNPWVWVLKFDVLEARRAA